MITNICTVPVEGIRGNSCWGLQPGSPNPDNTISNQNSIRARLQT